MLFMFAFHALFSARISIPVDVLRSWITQVIIEDSGIIRIFSLIVCEAPMQSGQSKAEKIRQRKGDTHQATNTSHPFMPLLQYDMSYFR